VKVSRADPSALAIDWLALSGSGDLAGRSARCIRTAELVTMDGSRDPEIVTSSGFGYTPARNPFEFWTKGVGLAHAFRLPVPASSGPIPERVPTPQPVPPRR
jgi:hypothetical protein